MAEKLGLVLSGGGAKGAYEAGAYKALVHYNIAEHITAFSGTSVGALNAVLFDSVGGSSADVWQGLKLTDMMSLDTPRLARAVTSLFSDEPSQIDPSTVKLSDPSAVIKYLYPEAGSWYTDGLPFSQDKLSSLLDKYVDFSKLSHRIYVHAVRFKKQGSAVTDMSLNVFRLNSVLYDNEQRKQMVLASAALPGVYCGTEGVKIKGMEYNYLDGGYPNVGDNTPIATLYDKGYRRIIAIHLTDSPNLSVQEKFHEAEIVNIIPSENMGGFITGTLNLSPDKIRRDLNMGYTDALAQINKIKALI